MGKVLGFWPEVKRRIRPQNRWLVWALVAAVVYFVTYAIWKRGEVYPSEWLDVLVIGILVLVTLIYVSETANIARRTSEQTREMRRQREQALLPILVGTCEVVSFGTDVNVHVHNIGPGPALEIGVSRVSKETWEVRRAWSVREQLTVHSLFMWDLGEMAAGGGSSVDEGGTAFPISHGDGFCIVVECTDTYGRLIGAVKEYKVMRDGSGRVWLKEIATDAGLSIKERVRDYPRREWV